jgi:type VI secretion system secreted protein VgrG
LPATLPEPPAVPALRDPDAPLFKIDCKAIPSSARVVSLQGSEAMSRPYAFEVRLQMEKPLSAKPFLEMKEVVDEQATLTFFDLEERERGKIHGRVAAIELLEGLQDDLLYRAVLVPKLASLGRNRRSCVYVRKTFPEILHEVLDKLNGWKEGEDYELALQGGYDSPLDQVCQYKESDLHFLTRLMEGEGVYYFFDQGKEREKVVIADHKQRHTTLAKRKDGTPGPAPKLYEPRSPTDRGLEESFWAFRERHTGGAGVAVKGYDYLNPLSAVESEAAGDDGPTLSFPDENVKTSKQAKRLAMIRKEEVEARRVEYRGEGPVYGLRPGYLITVIGFPGDSRKAEVLVTEVIHHGLLGGEARTGYRAEVAGIPAEVQYRPERRTPRPRIEGVERAVVDGPYNEEYAQIDKDGRYLVKIAFDESGLKDGRASMWVRMRRST